MRHSHSRRPLSVERLEDRAVPTTVTTTFTKGILGVFGTPGSDTIVVRQTGGTITVDGTRANVSAAAVRRIIVDAGSGNDTVRLDSHNFPGQEALSVAATVYSGDGNDAVSGSNRGDIVFGQNGDDRIMGGTGVDALHGGEGNDSIDAAGGNDQVSGGGGADSLNGGAGDDRAFGEAGNDSINGGGGNDSVFGGAGDDYLDGSADQDVVVGGDGRDALNGGSGFDSFQDDYVPPPANATTSAVAAAISSQRPGESAAALPADIRQQIADTCSLLASLAAFARISPTDLAQRITYDAALSQFLVPIFVSGQWKDIAVTFNGSWTDNEPYPGPDDGTGARDYWPVIYQRAYLQAQNVDTSAADAHQWAVRGTTASQLTSQLWRYPDVALRAVTGRAVSTDNQISDADFATIQAAVASGRDVIANTWTIESMRPRVDGTGLVFSHTYAVVGVTADAQGPILTLRNPWGVDNKAEALSALGSTGRAFFTMGNEADGVVQVRWATFKQAFATYVFETGV